MGKMQKRAFQTGDTKLKFFARCILSTVIGQLIDNGLFFLIAYMPNAIDPVGTGWGTAEIVWSYIWQQILAAWVIEVGIETVIFPLTHFLVKKVEKLEA